MEKTKIQKPTIQQRIDVRVSEILEPVETWLDRHAFTPERFNPKTLKLVDLFKREKVGGVHARKIQERYEDIYEEYKTLLDLRKKNIGFIFQSFNLIDELSVAENIELALLYHDMPSAERKQRVATVMDRMGIGHRANHMPGQLSGGQQQRVAVARAVVGDQPLILADEPTGNLDSVHGQEVMELLRSLNKEGTTIVMVTHSPAHADYAHRTVNLFDGHIVTENTRAA